MSDAEEALLWQIKAVGLQTPTREYRFDPVRKWRFDFAYVILQIAIEVEGGSWVAGAHTRGAHFEADCEKYNAAALGGWRMLRFTPAMIDDGRAIKTLEKMVRRG